jgi:hypothetical protein
MKDLEGLRLQALLSIAKGDYDGHPFRGNQWTRRASRGRAAPKDPTAGSQGGGSGKAKRQVDEIKTDIQRFGGGGGMAATMSRLDALDAQAKALLSKPAVKIDSSLPKESQEVLTALNNRFTERVKRFHPKDIPDIQQKVLEGIEEGKKWVSTVGGNEGYVKTGKKRADTEMDSALSHQVDRFAKFLGIRAGIEIASAKSGSKSSTRKPSTQNPTTPKPGSAGSTKEILRREARRILAEAPTAPKPAKAPTAPKPTKKKTKKEKDAEWEVLTAKQKKIYEKAPADMSHDDAMALALGL